MCSKGRRPTMRTSLDALSLAKMMPSCWSSHAKILTKVFVRSRCARPSFSPSSKDGDSVWSQDAWSRRPMASSVSLMMQLEAGRATFWRTRTSWCCVPHWGLPSILQPLRRPCRMSFGIIASVRIDGLVQVKIGPRHIGTQPSALRKRLPAWWSSDMMNGKNQLQIYSSLFVGSDKLQSLQPLCAEALGRRLLRCLVSMYYDDAHLTDLESNGKSSQWSFGKWSFCKLNAVLGTPFAEEKQQPLSDKGTFLGLDYGFTKVGSHYHVQFWVRERLESKVTGMIRDAKSTRILAPSQASKLHGTLNFRESGVFGRVGCGGLQPLKDHQYTEDAPHCRLA